jgi:hypothetical protein
MSGKAKYYDSEGEWEWTMTHRKPLRSGRLLLIERLPILEGITVPARVLTLCACGNTKICQLGDFRRERVRFCSANCRQRFDIRHPHCPNQRMLSFRTGKLLRLGPPKWDPVLKKGVFADGVV